jgi:hypothetical protein
VLDRVCWSSRRAPAGWAATWPGSRPGSSTPASGGGRRPGVDRPRRRPARLARGVDIGARASSRVRAMCGRAVRDPATCAGWELGPARTGYDRCHCTHMKAEDELRRASRAHCHVARESRYIKAHRGARTRRTLPPASRRRAPRRPAQRGARAPDRAGRGLGASAHDWSLAGLSRAATRSSARAQRARRAIQRRSRRRARPLAGRRTASWPSGRVGNQRGSRLHDAEGRPSTRHARCASVPLPAASAQKARATELLAQSARAYDGGISQDTTSVRRAPSDCAPAPPRARAVGCARRDARRVALDAGGAGHGSRAVRLPRADDGRRRDPRCSCKWRAAARWSASSALRDRHVLHLSEAAISGAHVRTVQSARERVGGGLRYRGACECEFEWQVASTRHGSGLRRDGPAVSSLRPRRARSLSEAWAPALSRAAAMGLDGYPPRTWARTASTRVSRSHWRGLRAVGRGTRSADRERRNGGGRGGGSETSHKCHN